MVNTAIIFCKDGVLIYTPHEEEKYQEIHDRKAMPLNWDNITMKQAKEVISKLKE